MVKKLTVSSGSVTVNLNGQPNGIYLVKLNGDTPSVIKLVKD